jgi:hypothetical protein
LYGAGDAESDPAVADISQYPYLVRNFKLIANYKLERRVRVWHENLIIILGFRRTYRSNINIEISSHWPGSQQALRAWT